MNRQIISPVYGHSVLPFYHTQNTVDCFGNVEYNSVKDSFMPQCNEIFFFSHHMELSTALLTQDTQQEASVSFFFTPHPVDSFCSHIGLTEAVHGALLICILMLKFAFQSSS